MTRYDATRANVTLNVVLRLIKLEAIVMVEVYNGKLGLLLLIIVAARSFQATK